MMKNRIILAVLLPFASMLTIAVWAGGLGTLFIILDRTWLGPNGAIIGGLLLIFLVPLVAVAVIKLLDKRREEPHQ